MSKYRFFLTKTCLESSGKICTASNMATECWWYSGAEILDKFELHFPASTEFKVLGTRFGLEWQTITHMKQKNNVSDIFDHKSVWETIDIITTFTWTKTLIHWTGNLSNSPSLISLLIKFYFSQPFSLVFSVNSHQINTWNLKYTDDATTNVT